VTVDGLVLGVDVGMSGARAAIMDRRGRVAACSARFRVPVAGGGGRAELESAAVTAAVLDALRDVLRAAPAGSLEAIAVAALGPAPVLVDRDLAAVSPALLFGLDTRAEDERRALAARHGLRDDELTHDHAVPKLEWWRAHEPERVRRAALALDLTGYVVAALTGVATLDAITARDYALPGGSASIALPPLRDAYDVAGGLRVSVASALGLPRGLPVLVGTLDSYADTAATGTLRTGDACVILGTTSIIAAVLPEAPPELHGLAATPHLGEGVVVGGWPASGGSALAWARALLGKPADFGDELDAAALALPAGAGGLVVLPYLAGERTPVHDAAARGVVLGLTLDTRPAELYRAVVDGVALSVRDHAERLRLVGVAPAAWRVAGGGARGDLLVRATCDALQARLEIVADADAPIGPCRLALHATGHDPPVAIARTLEPDRAAAARAERLYDVYRSLYPRLADGMHVLDQLSRPLGGAA
jgi:xylulokinase